MGIVIYSARTGRVRRIIHDSTRTDAELVVLHPHGVGEDVLTESTSALNVRLPHDLLQEQVSTITGKVPTNDRYALVRPNGDVTGAILADPDTGDAIRNLTLVAHDRAQNGWRQMRDGTFQRSLVDIQNDVDERETQRVALVNFDFIANPDVTQEQVDAKLAIVEADKGALEAELTARQGPR